MAEDSTRQGNLETTCWGLRPTTGHNGCLMMMMMMIQFVSKLFKNRLRTLSVEYIKSCNCPVCVVELWPVVR